jgi:4-diphosphocytidyl-2-C-methyl-D-erythritol kinase
VSARLTLAAPAKINLYLHITGRRPDGYHTLDSLVAFAGLADMVTLEESGEQSGTDGLAVSGPFADGLATGEDNLALKAAHALGEGVKPGHGGGVRIGLEKNIPVAAGLGGGSADAAAVLTGLASLWGADDLRLAGNAAEIVTGLGADVPVCLASRPIFMAGIGEVLGPAVELPEAGVVLVNPGVGLETAAVFRAYDEMDGGRADDEPKRRPDLDPAPGGAQALARALEGTANDLTDAALGLAPVIGKVLSELGALERCRLARMTGSGPTCFGLFDDAAAAQAAMEIIRAKPPQWWCWAGSLVASRDVVK